MERVKIMVILLLVVGALDAQARVEDVQSFTLKNGMQFLAVKNHSIPNADMYIFWKVGSRNEVPGITGLSHFFEHMMFNGAKKYGPKQFDRTMEALAGLLTEMFVYGFDESFINDFQKNVRAMTVEKAGEIIQKYFPQDHIQFVLIGKASDIRDVAKKYGEMSEKEIKADGF